MSIKMLVLALILTGPVVPGIAYSAMLVDGPPNETFPVDDVENGDPFSALGDLLSNERTVDKPAAKIMTNGNAGLFTGDKNPVAPYESAPGSKEAVIKDILSGLIGE